jgi:hypothetical protein
MGQNFGPNIGGRVHGFGSFRCISLCPKTHKKAYFRAYLFTLNFITFPHEKQGIFVKSPLENCPFFLTTAGENTAFLQHRKSREKGTSEGMNSIENSSIFAVFLVFRFCHFMP